MKLRLFFIVIEFNALFHNYLKHFLIAKKKHFFYIDLVAVYIITF